MPLQVRLSFSRSMCSQSKNLTSFTNVCAFHSNVDMPLIWHGCVLQKYPQTNSDGQHETVLTDYHNVAKFQKVSLFSKYKYIHVSKLRKFCQLK